MAYVAKSNFFTHSELLIKYKRNLLFVSVVAIIHFYVVPMKALKVLNVDVPDGFLNWALPLCLSWFAINYAYLFYAELAQWKSEKMINQPDFLGYTTDFSTISKSMEILSDNRLQVELTLGRLNTDVSRQTNQQGETYFVWNEEQCRQYMDGVTSTLMSKVKMDLQRIQSFDKAVRNYHWANKARHYFLDIAVPAIVVSVALFSPIRSYIICRCF